MPPVSSVRFGTDGWRAVIGEDFTFQNVRLVSQATAEYFERQQTCSTKKLIVIGFDRRFLSSEFAEVVAEVLAGNGYTVVLSQSPVPTPAVSWLVTKLKGRAGVMVTASHNPARFNGIKLKLHHGGPADSDTCRNVETLIGQHPVKSVSLKNARAKNLLKVQNFKTRYFNALRRMVDFDLIAPSRLQFAHDALYGVGAGCFEELLKETNCEVRTFNSQHDPNFGGISPEPIERNYTNSRAALRIKPADFCLVTDGDADRIGGMDGRGNALTSHQIICLLLEHFIKNRRKRGRVVKGLTTTSMVDVVCLHHGLPLTETGVGFKYVCREMIKGDVLLGFEESGGIGFPEHVPERDGILAGLMVLEMLSREGKPLTTLLRRMTVAYGPHEYGRIDLDYPLCHRNALMRGATKHSPADLLGSPLNKIESFDGIKFTAHNGCWLMLRGSGTEPILRIYAEAPTRSGVKELLQKGQSIADRVK